MTANPFFEDWATPFGMPPFDRISPEHFPLAFDRAMADHLAEIEAVASNPDPATFANTIEALERGGRLMDKVASTFFNLSASNSSDALEAIERDYAPRLTRHRMRIALDPALFARIDSLFARRDTLGLAEDQLRLLERRHLEFVRSGAALGPEAKDRMAKLSERLSVLQTAFGQNVLHDEKTWHMALAEDDLAGLPEPLRAAAAEAARERGLAGWVITLARSSVEPFVTFSERRELRRQAYDAWTRRGAYPGEHDNRPIIREIVGLRAEQARLMGYQSYADFRLDDTMAKSVGAVRRLLDEVWEPAKGKAAEERAQLEEIARAEGMNEPVEAWDWRFYAEKVRRARYDIDDGEVKPYFVLENIAEAVFDTAGRLFGLSFHPRDDVPVYHPDVKAFEVRDKASGKAIGLFLQDAFARTGKHSGAWMSSYRKQRSLDGDVLPIIVNNNNLAKASPTLLSFDDAKTLFHEFGHALHGLLSKVRYPSQSGTAVRRDFVEFPSQVFEHWLTVPETLRKYARHYRTNEPIPDHLLDKLLAAMTFNQGFATVEYTAAALLDLAFHGPDGAEVEDVDGFEARVLDKIGMPREIGVRHRPAHFGHLFAGGYAAGYYAYLWAEVLDADGFKAFEEKGDAFDPALAAGLKAIYSAGDSRDPMALYAVFRGRQPTVDPLLEKRGLKAQTAA